MDFYATFNRKDTEDWAFGPGDREDWAELCEAIAGMTKLRTLRMRLYSTSATYPDEHEKQRSGALRRFSQNFFGRPKDPEPMSEEFILDSLYQIDQVREFEVKLDDRWRGSAVPEGQFNAPFKLIWEYEDDKRARRK